MDTSRALDFIEKAIQLVPNNEEYWFWKGNLILK